ncbi:hypothetical protein S40288_10375 [Stachybotrys chartarum IBT 40288]|nr:hypothetical protein S40288_10375 [Stachybotrys chartarum IBT 40288]
MMSEESQPLEQPTELKPRSLLQSYGDEINAILDNCQRERPEDSTVRPDLPPEPLYGKDFVPLKMTFREPLLQPLPPTAIQLFEAFVPEALVAQWVIYMNKATTNAQIKDWEPVFITEIYIWLAILIYMGMHKESGFRDYWKASTAESYYPAHSFKIWVLAQKGYFLAWIGHSPYNKYSPAGKPPRKKRGEVRAPALNPTQSVVPFLVKRLPTASYYVFLDNLFSSPQLFEQLRNEGHGATGTARPNYGIFKDLVDAKVRDKAGKCWK